MKNTLPMIERTNLLELVERSAKLALLDDDQDNYKKVLYEFIDEVLFEIAKVEQKGFPEFLIKTVEQSKEVFTATRHLLTIKGKLTEEEISHLKYFYYNLLRGFKC